MDIPEKFLSEWDYIKNWESDKLLPDYTPLDIPVWWKCPFNNKHSWRTSVEKRTKGVGCPYCVSFTYSGILTRHPELMKEWDHERNIISMYEVTWRYSKKVHWICKSEAGVCDCHRWEDTVSHRIRSPSCPYCTGRKICAHSSMVYIYPDLLHSWDHERNIIKPDTVKPKGKKRYWWTCPEEHSWQGTIKSRLATKDCPHCTEGLTIDKTHPRLLEEWGDNGDLKPSMFLAGNRTRVKWVCKRGVCGCHVWIAPIRDRAVLGNGCPYCSSSKICIHASLKYTHPELMEEWDPRNWVLPTEVSHGSNKKVSWVCKNGVGRDGTSGAGGVCGCHVWEATINSRASGSGCPYCIGQKTCVHSSLQTTHPELLKEWDPDNIIKPYEVGKGSDKKVSWICKKYPVHKWSARVCNRALQNTGCPLCLGR